MKKHIKTVLMGISALALTGCITTEQSTTPKKETMPMAKSSKQAMMKKTSTRDNIQAVIDVDDGVTIKITFENQKAYDSCQLGLVLYGLKMQPPQKLKIEDPSFFPDYFSIINSDIDDGLLFISQKEAEAFAEKVYNYYKSTQTVPDFLNVKKSK